MTPEARAERPLEGSFRSAGLGPIHAGGFRALIVEAIRDAVAEEREACAAVAETFILTTSGTDTGTIWRNSAAVHIAAAIRARS